MNRTSCTRTSFFVLVSERCRSLQEALSPYLQKLQSFTHCSCVFVKLGGCAKPLKGGHYWKVDLTRPMQTSEYSASAPEKLYILLFTHIECCHFVFRIFDCKGTEKEIFSFTKTCLCCAENDENIDEMPKTPVTVDPCTDWMTKPEHLSSQIQPKFEHVITNSLNSRILDEFSLDLSGKNARKGYSLALPRALTTSMPFSMKECEITLLASKSDKRVQCKIKYVKYTYKYAVKGRLQKGWDKVVQSLQLEEGDRCKFTLINSDNWSYDMQVTRHH